MRIYNPIYPSIKNNLEELFGKAPTSITLRPYSVIGQNNQSVQSEIIPLRPHYNKEQ